MTSNEPERRKPPSGPLTSGTAHAYLEDQKGEPTATGKESAEEVETQRFLDVFTVHDDPGQVVSDEFDRSLPPNAADTPDDVAEPDIAAESGDAPS